MEPRRVRPPLILATAVNGADGGPALAAAVGVAAATAAPECGVLVAELGSTHPRRPTLLSSAAANELEQALRGAGLPSAAARGGICWLGLASGEEGLRELMAALDAAAGARLAILVVSPSLWQEALETAPAVVGALIRAQLPRDRALAALAVGELRRRGVKARIATRPLGRVAARRALAGLPPGGAASGRIGRLTRALAGEGGQSLPLALGSAFAVVFVTLVLAALGGAVSGAARVQRAADLVALSAARSLHDDLPRTLAPAILPDGSANPAHLDRAEYLSRAVAAARDVADRNGVPASRVRVTFPGSGVFPPLRARAVVTAIARGSRVEEWGEAEAAPAAGWSGTPTDATGGGYAGPLAYRQGEAMRPDVAVAFDRLAAAARRAGLDLAIASAYRSDAEQALLYAQNPDPRWVAPPGRSLHRCATELDLGPPAAYGWLAANARRFGFLRRYSWEPWHYGYSGGPAPCSPTDAGLAGAEDGAVGGAPGLPAFVPARFRQPLARAAARWNVSAALLAAQLLAESGFDPFAVSPAGARGIAQFMPATAAAYGLRDPFDASAAIDAQARLMSDLLRQFGAVPLALAAYNAGPAPVAACRCVPSYPETRAYVARILGLLEGAGDLVTPALEVRLVA